MRTLIVHGSTYGDTADAAQRIAERIEHLSDIRPELRDVGGLVDLAELERYEVILIGCSTWNVGELQADWQDRLPELEGLDLHGKRVALFGSGDQSSYPDTFQDALGILARELESLGATIIGSWPAADYEFDASLALRGSHFVGLALDYICQMEKSEDRIAAWTTRLLEELAKSEERTVLG